MEKLKNYMVELGDAQTEPRLVEDPRLSEMVKRNGEPMPFRIWNRLRNSDLPKLEAFLPSIKRREIPDLTEVYEGPTPIELTELFGLRDALKFGTEIGKTVGNKDAIAVFDDEVNFFGKKVDVTRIFRVWKSLDDGQTPQKLWTGVLFKKGERQIDFDFAESMENLKFKVPQVDELLRMSNDIDSPIDLHDYEGLISADWGKPNIEEGIYEYSQVAAVHNDFVSEFVKKKMSDKVKAFFKRFNFLKTGKSTKADVDKKDRKDSEGILRIAQYYTDINFVKKRSRVSVMFSRLDKSLSIMEEVNDDVSDTEYLPDQTVWFDFDGNNITAKLKERKVAA